MIAESTDIGSTIVVLLIIVGLIAFAIHRSRTGGGGQEDLSGRPTI